MFPSHIQKIDSAGFLIPWDEELANKLNFQCYGKFNDGRKCHYKIKDISPDGCAITVENNEVINSLCGTTLRNVEFDFNDIGTLVSNLQVINVEPGDRDFVHLSCQFKRMALTLIRPTKPQCLTLEETCKYAFKYMQLRALFKPRQKSLTFSYTSTHVLGTKSD